ncbi:hypothetical protein COOONC_24032 [Cooperia oncophora]
MLKTMMPDQKSNLMDHMFDMLEDYTTTLEQVADRLKLGQTVEPENFGSVTVFFSDVVKFTQLAAKCTPFQTVNLLNDLYNGFDSIIEVDIGDGSVCRPSGLPSDEFLGKCAHQGNLGTVIVVHEVCRGVQGAGSTKRKGSTPHCVEYQVTVHFELQHLRQRSDSGEVPRVAARRSLNATCSCAVHALTMLRHQCSLSYPFISNGFLDCFPSCSILSFSF